MPYIIYADIESLIKKIDGYETNWEKYSTVKIGDNIPCEYSMSTIWRFDHIKDKHALYHEKDCMKEFCESLREHAKSITGFEKKKMLSLIRKELESHENQKVCCICGIRFFKYLFRDFFLRIFRISLELIEKLEIIVITQANVAGGASHGICNWKFKVMNLWWNLF